MISSGTVRLAMAAALAMISGCGVVDPPASERAQGTAADGDKPNDPRSERVEQVKSFALSEAKRYLTPGLLAPGDAVFHPPGEPRPLPGGSEGMGRPYELSGDLDAKNAFGVQVRYRWTIVVGVRGRVDETLKFEVRQRDEEPKVLFVNSGYAASERRRREAEHREAHKDTRWLGLFGGGEDESVPVWRGRDDAEAHSSSRKSLRASLLRRQVAQGRAKLVIPRAVTLVESDGMFSRIRLDGEETGWVRSDELRPYTPPPDR